MRSVVGAGDCDFAHEVSCSCPDLKRAVRCSAVSLAEPVPGSSLMAEPTSGPPGKARAAKGLTVSTGVSVGGACASGGVSTSMDNEAMASAASEVAVSVADVVGSVVGGGAGVAGAAGASSFRLDLVGEDIVGGSSSSSSRDH